MATKNIVPRATGEGSLGTADKKWAGVYSNEVTVNGTALTSKLASVDSSISTIQNSVSGKVDTSTYNTKMTSIDSSISELSNGKVSKAGDTITGDILSNVDGYIRFASGTDSSDAAKPSKLALSTSEGRFYLCAGNGTELKNLIGDANGNLTWCGKGVATNDYPKHYKVRGFIANRDGVETTNGHGIAEVICYASGIAEIHYQFRVDAVDGTNSYNWGLNAHNLKGLNSDIPNLTAIEGGSLTIYNADGTVNMSKMGYGCFHIVSSDGHWCPARQYDTNRSVGSWGSTSFSVGMYFVGVAIATFTP